MTPTDPTASTGPRVPTDQPVSVDRGPTPRPPTLQTPSAQHRRRQHLTEHWSLVTAGEGILGTLARFDRADTDVPTVRRAVAVPSVRNAPSLDDRSAASSRDHRIAPVDPPSAQPPSARPPAASLSPASPRETASGPPPVPELAERFMTELSRSVRRRAAPLPVPFRPMADHVAGERRVMLSTDSASRRALRSVGKVAATTGDTIHLDPAAASAARLNEVVAHELTHIANPSPTPRFFDDVVDSPEERRADATARIMARSPLAPTASVLAAPGAAVRRTADSTIRRAPASGAHRNPPNGANAAGPGSISATALAASITGSRSSGTGATGTVSGRTADTSTSTGTTDVVRRALTIGGHRTQTPSTGSSGTVPAATSSASPPEFSLDSSEAASWFEDQLERHMATIARRLGEQIVIDLERRGGRLWGGI